MNKILARISEAFSDDERPDEPAYDPVHIGMTVVFSLLALTALFWLLWALLVFGGGIQAKLVPMARVIFSGASPAEYGYAGYPYQMGVFEGLPTNLAALAIAAVAAAAVGFIYRRAASGFQRKEGKR